MRRISLKNLVVALGLVLLVSSAADGQSLGDVARENREKRTEGAPVAQPKVITNKDLPKDPAADESATAAPPVAAPRAAEPVSPEPVSPERREAEKRAERRFAQQRLAEQRAGEQWKRQILAQKDKMANLQAQIDNLKATVQFANVSSGGPYNRVQARQFQRIAQLQMQLDGQKRKLEQMQDAARHAGMHTAVYDP